MSEVAIDPSFELSPRERQLRAENRELNARLAMLEGENKTLLARITELVGLLAEARDTDRQLELKLELKILRDRVDERNRQLYGTRSERRGRPDPIPPVEKKQKRSGSTRTAQPKLGMVDKIHVLDEADRMCPKCGGRLHAKADHFECNERVVVSERVYTLVNDKKQVYGCGDCGTTDTALGPPQLVPGGRYDTSIAVQAAVDKAIDHQPINRQVQAMKRAGLSVTTQALWDQLYALSEICAPSYERLHDWLLAEHDVLHADETPWRMMNKGGSSQWWMWSLASPRGVFFTASPSRGADVARGLVRDFAGTLMVDGYVAYASLANEAANEPLPLADGGYWRPRFRLANCWMHCRRPFFKASSSDDEAHVALDLIAELYTIEAKANDEAKDDYDALLVARRRLRDTDSRAVIARLDIWRKRVLALPKTQFDDGLRYLRNQWCGLTRFLTDPAVPLDNGLAERLIRGPVLGRKNHQGSRSERGARASAMFYSLLGSCTMLGVPPDRYLRTLVDRALGQRDYVLLPHEFAAELKAEAGPMPACANTS